MVSHVATNWKLSSKGTSQYPAWGFRLLCNLVDWPLTLWSVWPCSRRKAEGQWPDRSLGFPFSTRLQSESLPRTGHSRGLSLKHA